MDIWLRGAGSTLSNAGKMMYEGLDDLGQKAGQALDSLGKQVEKDLGRSHPLHIAITKAGIVSESVGRESLRFLDMIGQQTEMSVSEAYNHAHQHVSQVDWERLSQEARAWIEGRAKELEIGASVVADHVLYIVESSLPKEIAQWIAEHPGQTTFIVVSGVVFFAPSLITIPVLNSLGFTAGGVAGGSAAAAMQSIIGPVQAQSIFALMQSAATGGVGLAVINGMISAGAGVGMGVVAGTIAGEEGCLSDSEKKENCHGETNAR